jgi:hypothetical protein
MGIGVPPVALALAVAGLIVLWLCYAESRRSDDDAADCRRGRNRRSHRQPAPVPARAAAPPPPPPESLKDFAKKVAGSGFINQKKINDFVMLKYEINTLDDLIKKVEPTLNPPSPAEEEEEEPAWDNHSGAGAAAR